MRKRQQRRLQPREERGKGKEGIGMTGGKWGKIGLDGETIEKPALVGVTPLRMNEGNGPTVCGWESGKCVRAKVETRVLL